MSSVIEDLAALPRFLTVKETCAFLGVSASTVKRFVKSGDLRQWTPERGHRKITRDSVARLVGVDPACIPNRRKSTEEKLRQLVIMPPSMVRPADCIDLTT